MEEFLAFKSSPNQFIIEFPGRTRLYLKREDLLHPEVSGNKFRKLKYNLKEAFQQNKDSLLTFGGAYSNHIAATAAAGKISGIKTIGVIRGEELGVNFEKNLLGNPTLKFAHSCGMRFLFISRSDFREKATPDFQQKLKEKFGDYYMLPEGGTNALAVKGCAEILDEDDKDFDFIACAAGTGGTMAGLLNTSGKHQKILGFPALKGDFLETEVQKFSLRKNYQFILNYHFGGYAKVDSELINFINKFQKNYQIQLDPIYTGKLVFGIFDLVKKGFFAPGTSILAIHTGGLQGIAGINKRLKQKKLPQIRNLEPGQ